MDEQMKTLGEQLVELRELKGVSKNQLVLALKMSHKRITSIEEGTGSVNSEKLFKWLELVGGEMRIGIKKEKVKSSKLIIEESNV